MQHNAKMLDRREISLSRLLPLLFVPDVILGIVVKCDRCARVLHGHCGQSAATQPHMQEAAMHCVHGQC